MTLSYCSLVLVKINHGFKTLNPNRAYYSIERLALIHFPFVQQDHKFNKSGIKLQVMKLYNLLTLLLNVFLYWRYTRKALSPRAIPTQPERADSIISVSLFNASIKAFSLLLLPVNSTV